REVESMVLQRLQVARWLVIGPSLLWEEVWRVQPQRPADQEHALGAHSLGFAIGTKSDRQHGVEQWQADRDTGCAEECAGSQRQARHGKILPKVGCRVSIMTRHWWFSVDGAGIDGQPLRIVLVVPMSTPERFDLR